MKRTPLNTKPDPGPINDHDRKRLEAANVALRDELVTATVVINRAKQRAEDAEAELAEAQDERDTHAARVAELEWQLAEAESERHRPIASMKNDPIPTPIVTSPEAPPANAPAEGAAAAAIAAELIEVMAANVRKHAAPRQRKAAAKPTPTPAPNQTVPTLAYRV